MKRFTVVSLAVVMVLSTLFFNGSVLSASAKETKIMEFGTMTGVPRPYTGNANAIRGLPGGGLPWVIGFAEGELKADGKIEVTVRGLLIDPNDAAAIASGRAGTNPSPNMKVVVSCLSKDGSGAPTTVNVSTGLFPVDANGNGQIEDMVSLPQPCIAPIIFVTSATGSWFAATGF